LASAESLLEKIKCWFYLVRFDYSEREHVTHIICFETPELRELKKG
jgi:hypothetical protein